jgi:hypothetical protein
MYGSDKKVIVGILAFLMDSLIIRAMQYPNLDDFKSLFYVFFVETVIVNILAAILFLKA